MHYPPETSSIGLVIRILATIVQAQDPEEQIGILMSLMHDTVNKKEQLAHKMLGERFVDQLEQLRLACTTAFASYPVVSSFLTPDGFAAIFALIGRNSQGIGTSAFAVWTKKVEKLATKPNEKSQLEKLIDTVYDAIEQNAGSFLNNEGSGLYAKQSTINHSCDPNAEVEFPFNNHELVVNASKNISTGEEILISYLECCDLERSRHSRSKMLSENYLFLCDCMKCQSQMGDPDVTSDEEMSSEEPSEDEDGIDQDDENMDDLDGELIIDTVPIFNFGHNGTKYTVVQYIDILPLVAQEGAMGAWKLLNAEEGDKVFDVVYEHDLEDMITEAQNEELQNA